MKEPPPCIYLLQHALPRTKKRQTDAAIIFRRNRCDVAHHLPPSDLKLSSFSSILPAHDLQPSFGYVRLLRQAKDESEPGVKTHTMNELRADIFRKWTVGEE